MNELMAILIGIFFILAGFITVNFFTKGKYFSFFESIPYCYGIGIGVVATELFVYSQFSIPWTRESIIIPWLILWGLYIFVLNKKKKKVNVEKKKHFSFWDKLLLFLIVMLALFVGFESLLRPLMAWDGISNWIVKSNVFYIDQTIKPSVLLYLNDGYPLLVGLAGTAFYTFLGRIDDRLILILF